MKPWRYITEAYRAYLGLPVVAVHVPQAQCVWVPEHGMMPETPPLFQPGFLFEDGVYVRDGSGWTRR